MIFFLIFCTKHRLWVHVRTASAVLTSTHNLYFEAKIRKIGIPLHIPVFYIKVEFKGVYIARTCFPDDKRLIDFIVLCGASVVHGFTANHFT